MDGSILFIRKIRIVGKCSQSLEFTIVEAGIPSRVFYNCISYSERLLETITFILGLPSWYAATAAAAKSPQLCPTLCDPTDQAPLSLGFSRQEYWSGLPFPSPMCESEVALEPTKKGIPHPKTRRRTQSKTTRDALSI